MPPESSPATLSGGESQRLALAGALVLEPSVLLLDEPTAMLDAATAADVRAVVADVVARRGLTLVVVEHRLDGWLDRVDRLVVLDASGSVIADGEPWPVLAEHGESLAAQGIWVPGVPDPEPLALVLDPAPDAAAGRVPQGRVVAAASGVRVEHRSRRLGERSRTTLAVDGSDLEARAGRSLALVGPSGAGKSSLMSALGGLVDAGAWHRGRRAAAHAGRGRETEPTPATGSRHRTSGPRPTSRASWPGCRSVRPPRSSAAPCVTTS